MPLIFFQKEAFSTLLLAVFLIADIFSNLLAFFVKNLHMFNQSD